MMQSIDYKRKWIIKEIKFTKEIFVKVRGKQKRVKGAFHDRNNKGIWKK